MPDSPTPLNPYAPTPQTGSPRLQDGPAPDGLPPGPLDDSDGGPERPDSLSRVALRWAVVCGISAVPSFFYGYMISDGQVLAMLLGIAIFAVVYTILDYQTAHWPIRKRPTVRRTLRITYGTRIAISILVPVGGYLDLMCGLVTITTLQTVWGFEVVEGMPFAAALVATLVQGIVLNLVLAVYGLVVHGVQLAILALRG